MTTTATQRAADVAIPCAVDQRDLWFSAWPRELDLAKTLCRACPVLQDCLAGALERAEPWGVWGGEIFDRGRVVAVKRRPGRPPKSPAAAA